MSQFIPVAKISDIPEGEGKAVEAGERFIALFNVRGKFYAMDNTCHHAGGPLGEGGLTGTKVMCPWHGWEYDVTTGECTTEPVVKQKTYPVKVEGEDILIEIGS